MASPTCGLDMFRFEEVVNFQGKGAQSAAAPMNITNQYPAGGLQTKVDGSSQLSCQHTTPYLCSHNPPHPGPPMQRRDRGAVGHQPLRPVPPATLPHPSSHPNTTTYQAPPWTNAPIPLNVHAPMFIPSNLRRTKPIRITKPNGEPVTFEGRVPPAPKVRGPFPAKHQSVPVHMETEKQRNERLGRGRAQMEYAAKEKAERGKNEKMRNAKGGAEKVAKEEVKRGIRERRVEEQSVHKAEAMCETKEETREMGEELWGKDEAVHKTKGEGSMGKTTQEAERMAWEEVETTVFAERSSFFTNQSIPGFSRPFFGLSDTRNAVSTPSIWAPDNKKPNLGAWGWKKDM
ncbi:hypothetical protein RSOLAG22IIIB_05587 [Rhizoctonia solani]|uniref:Uncharacterized protein n=1 Tax=Rhizoctonia solani TaxID=456999 RepID=A0A0K6G7E1_9AGAM|nr:hypothetical protein RSOLAG22IIIB_05587 [Rhizoctonia solani]